MYSYIKLTADPNQSYTLVIPGDKNKLTLKIQQSYNRMAEYWTMDIYDSSSNALIMGIPMLPGYDLLAQYQYMGIGSAMVVNTGDPSVSTPDSTSIADNFVLSWRH